ncbi:DUF2232 domain-containing protein [Sinorhizobium alkalisoli]|uniref:DUF2232 domain-containing protein n=1 Tax=Sinorhizobium alkalisoli TaxID=1752398 RepID=A0A1E3V6Y7_9HYPH|nr:DUF2232 domain-containing protein [Sinorhizobium alkalisoli]MCG5478033.1 DUF2232 domain-containing protein [Sinorhizobium alkalisoli]ODR89197.1 DUF2232 domain-containing protein [Sinorhizobium alkalisoli]QFI65644.1 hypothetical protein EKH55_0770 [Sinorhizobium alkalisoli]
MQNWNRTSLIVGALAGITAALLSMGANTQSSFAIVLYAASALPILIAGLGWGNAAAIAAIAAASVTAASLASPYFALLILVVTLIPAGWLSHLANLARPASEIGGPESALAWYPLSDILSHLAGLVTIGMIIVGYIVGYDASVSDLMVDMLIEAVKAQEPLYNPDAASVAQLKAIFTLALPLVQGAVWVMMLFSAYYLAIRIVQMSGRSVRPREDIPSTLRMHRNAIFIFLAGLVLAFIGGAPATIGALVCGTFGAGFLLSGFASFHYRTRGRAWRLPVLWIAYLSVFVFTLPALFFLLFGLTDTRRTIAVTPTGKS